MDSLLEQLKLHDIETYHHSLRVAHLSRQIARSLDYSEEEQRMLYQAGLLHDIGKLKIAKEILSKPSKLSMGEWEMIQQHPIFGYDILRNNLSVSKDITDIVLYHHERINGSGYPFQLKGDEVPLNAQVIAVADSFDAMTSHRAYSKAKTVQEALDEILFDKGRLFKPIVVDTFSQMLVKQD